jgi:3-hydroxy-D-aspartate aldolase
MLYPAHVPPAEVGMAVEDVDTPALLVELDAFEANLERMASKVADSDVELRPHAKAHKCPAIGLQQMAHGAKGLCCQKVGEAEAMVNAGINNVLITNEIVGASKLKRLAALSKRAWLGVCVDDPWHIEQLNAAALAVQTKLHVLVEINVGANRCGVEPGEPALRLARQIAASPGLHFCGLQAYHGSAQHLRTPEERAQAIAGALAKATLTVELLERSGLKPEIVSGAGTGSFEHEAASGIYNELQVGSYVFMDADYCRNTVTGGRPFTQFEPSLFVLCSVMSKPDAERCVVDAGLKSLAFDSGAPEVRWPGATYGRPSDEHGVVSLGPDSPALGLGDKVQLFPGHCDPTVNLYDWIVGIRRARVECLWPVAARGASR